MIQATVNTCIVERFDLIPFTPIAKSKKGKKIRSGEENVVTKGCKNVKTHSCWHEKVVITLIACFGMNLKVMTEVD